MAENAFLDLAPRKIRVKIMNDAEDRARFQRVARHQELDGVVRSVDRRGPFNSGLAAVD
jgi:hypothetical protein